MQHTATCSNYTSGSNSMARRSEFKHHIFIIHSHNSDAVTAPYRYARIAMRNCVSNAMHLNLRAIYPGRVVMRRFTSSCRTCFYAHCATEIQLSARNRRRRVLRHVFPHILTRRHNNIWTAAPLPQNNRLALLTPRFCRHCFATGQFRPHLARQPPILQRRCTLHIAKCMLSGTVNSALSKSTLAIQWYLTLTT